MLALHIRFSIFINHVGSHFFDFPILQPVEIEKKCIHHTSSLQLALHFTFDRDFVAREDDIDRGVAGGERLAKPAPAQAGEQRLGRRPEPHRAAQASALVNSFSHRPQPYVGCRR